MKIDIGMLNRSFQRALLFNIPHGVRLISYEQKNEFEIEMLVICERELNKDEKDYLYSASGEIEGDFIDIKICNVKFIVNTNIIDNIETMKHIVFAMAE